MSEINRLLLVLCIVGAAACRHASDGDDGELSVSTRNHLVWKRGWAVRNDLAAALELEPDAVCVELGALDCVRDVHMTSLGEHDAFAQGVYSSVREPLLTTPLAIGRMAFEACHFAFEDDERAIAVLGDVELNATVADLERASAITRPLYRRLFGRDALEIELEVISSQLVPSQLPTREFATTTCVALATSAEFIFI